MGTTVSSIHIYTNEPIPEGLGSFVSFSKGWQTRLPQADDAFDYETDQKNARKLSRAVPCPVLHFWEFDGDAFGFTLFFDGKQASVFSTDSTLYMKGLFKLPPLIGYADGNKRRLSTILSCADIEASIAMLEEYFGVCLEVFYDLLDSPQDLKRLRSDKKYKDYLEEEKRFKKKNAAIRVELRQEIFGKLERNAVFGDRSRPREHIFYLAQFHTDKERTSPLPAVEFRQGKLIPADELAIYAAPIEKPVLVDDPRFHVDYYPKTIIKFTEAAPAPYRGKVFSALPRGYYPYGFDENDCLILVDEKAPVSHSWILPLN